jgi:DNA-binding NarL/FixJ family response regulator
MKKNKSDSKDNKPSAPKKTKILIVDDHPIIRQGLKELIEQEADFLVCGQAENAIQAIKAVREVRPDVAIVDLSLNKDFSGLELIKDIKIQFPKIIVLVLSMHDETIFAERVLRAGAMGYVMKEEATEKVLVALRKVLNGDIYLSERVSGKILSKMVNSRSSAMMQSPVERLSDRELEIFELIGQGIGSRLISEKLHISVKTVEAHRLHIREKLKLKSAPELLQYAIKWVQADIK